MYGLDDRKGLAEETGFTDVQEHSLTPAVMIRQLTAGERIVFSNLYAGTMARRLYRLYEFRT